MFTRLCKDDSNFAKQFYSREENVTSKSMACSLLTKTEVYGVPDGVILINSSPSWILMAIVKLGFWSSVHVIDPRGISVEI